ncbi:MAG TPA: heavy metal translocating P-type ATPase [Candidatus Sulfotelmatobacter sp.]|nr:heavy metal translocating P-type ATPase [Candidatus Sulfotelmatobacter sp.]
MAPPRREITWRRVLPLVLAAVAVLGIAAHLVARASGGAGAPAARIPLLVVLAAGGIPLVLALLWRMLHGELGSDLLAGISIVAAWILGEHLAGSIVVLMLAGGEALEQYAVRRASSVLHALMARMPQSAHRRQGDVLVTIALDAVAPGDEIVVLPHETCPVDGVVVSGHGAMDESYLTGEPYVIAKAPGSEVLSGAVNGESALTIRASRRARDSRYAEIVEIMRRAESSRPRLRRLADRLGAAYTPLALIVAAGAYLASGSWVRALSVLVVATPCPLILAIPVAIVGAVSLAAKRGIVVRDPAVLERLDSCRTMIFDKTGTLTYGRPALTDVALVGGSSRDAVLALAAGLEAYSKHPLAAPVVEAARQRGLPLEVPDEVSERPGAGLTGRLAGHLVEITGRARLAERRQELADLLPPAAPGLEAVVLVDGAAAAVLRFRDEPREESLPFIRHLAGRHGVTKILLVSGDRSAEAEYLAEKVGIRDVRSEQRPEDKVAIVRQEAAAAPTLFVGDGINDAPALAAATVGVAFGRSSDVIAEAAGAVLLETSLLKVDELFHIARRIRAIALQSAVGGMMLSIAGMGAAAAGFLTPVAGAVLQEIIDVFAIANALRASRPPGRLHDYDE